jgi:hypothetical protein
MKKLTLIISTLIFLQLSSKAQDSLAANDPLVLQIQNLNLNGFTGKPVDSLLSYLPAGYTLAIQGSVVLKKAGYLLVEYAPYTYIYIAVRTFTHMNPNLSPTGNPTQNWDINLFRKEVLSFAVAFNGSCINGCEHLFKIN